jgi:hypothetical protein
MVDRHSLYKVKKVVIWLRCGCAFSKTARVGYDFAKNDEYSLTVLIYGPHQLVSLHRHNEDLENR